MSTAIDAAPRAAKSGAAPFSRRDYCLRFLGTTLGALLVLRSADARLAELDAPPLLQPLWSGLIERWPWTLAHAGFAGTLGAMSFFVTCMCFTVLDVTRCYTTKIQKGWWPGTRDLLAAAVPQCTIYLVANGLGWRYGYHPIALPASAPRLTTLAAELLVAFVVGDFLIYWEHRVMHMVPYLRKNIHSVHHAYTAPFSWSGGCVHPLEDLTVVLCQGVTPLLLGHHPLSLWVFTVLWVMLLVEEHSGHDVRWAPYNWMPYARCPMGGGGAPHDIHHYKVTKNFGFVLCVWDHLFGTFEPVVLAGAWAQQPKEEARLKGA